MIGRAERDAQQDVDRAFGEHWLARQGACQIDAPVHHLEAFRVLILIRGAIVQAQEDVIVQPHRGCHLEHQRNQVRA